MSNDRDNDRPWQRQPEEPYGHRDDPPRRDDDDRDRPRRRNDDDDYRGGGGGYGGRRYREPHRGGMILALGLIGILACGICGIFAWVMGNTDLKKMDAGEMDPEGRGLTQAGRILGIICTIIMIVYLVIVVIFCGIGGLGAAAGK